MKRALFDAPHLPKIISYASTGITLLAIAWRMG
jgi:hypothetical protein